VIRGIGIRGLLVRRIGIRRIVVRPAVPGLSATVLKVARHVMSGVIARRISVGRDRGHQLRCAFMSRFAPRRGCAIEPGKLGEPVRGQRPVHTPSPLWWLPRGRGENGVDLLARHVVAGRQNHAYGRQPPSPTPRPGPLRCSAWSAFDTSCPGHGMPY